MLRFFLPAFLACAAALHAADYYVDPAVGDDHANGLAAKAGGTNGPVKTIARAVKAAQPGDTVHLATAVFKESAVFHNRAGEPGKPITLDGHGATLDGSDALNPADWPEVSPGLFRNDNLLRLDDAVLQRWFFLWDGKMNHMGRTSKGLRPDHVGTMVLDIERGRADRILPAAWQTDTCIGDWHYNRRLFEEHKYKTVGQVLRTEPASAGPLTVTGARVQQGRWYVTFAGVSDRTAAEALAGVELVVDEHASDEDDAWYPHELAGLGRGQGHSASGVWSSRSTSVRNRPPV